MFIKNLSFKFDRKSDNFFFHNVAINFLPNTVHFIQGDNGVGKSTFFTLLQGAISKDAVLEASIELDDKLFTASFNQMPYEFTKQVHAVQQNYDLMIADQFTFNENLKLANLPRYPSLRLLPQETSYDIIKLLNIDPNKKAYLLSGGQRQLLAILMSLQKSAKVLLLDEPTATLDQKNADLIMQCLFQLSKQLKITILIICHDAQLIKQYGQATNFSIIKKENELRIIEKK